MILNRVGNLTWYLIGSVLKLKKKPILRNYMFMHLLWLPFSRPNIPGYQGCTLWQGVYAPAHSTKIVNAQSTTSTVHK